MKNRVLYFPYIQIPESPWLTQMLLYWDQVASIVPYDFIAEPEALGPYMRSLVAEELVLQVFPGGYIPDVPRFTESFQRYLNGLVDIGARRQRFDQKDTIRIHMEKVGPIGERLKDEGLARLERYPWYDVESQTADDFMAYLATVLGQIPEIGSTPVTDQDQSLDALVSAGVAPLDVEVQLDTLRLRILDRVLPTPDHAVNAGELRRFRDRHGDALPDFRRSVERELVTLAGIADETLRERRLALFFEEADQRIAEILSWMDGRGWSTTLGKLSGILVAVPGVAPIFGLANAVREAVANHDEPLPAKEFAYAAYAKGELHEQVSGAVQEVV